MTPFKSIAAALEAERIRQVKAWLFELNESQKNHPRSDKNARKRIRAMLRSLGHKGGTRSPVQASM